MKVIDIETIPQPGIMNTWYPERARKKMPDATDEEIYAKAALHGEFGMVCAIGISDAAGAPSHALATDFDTMEMMRFAGDCPMSLRSACFLLGLGDPKAACSGAEVLDLFNRKEFEKIGRYVESDVKFTAQLFKKILELAT